MTPNALSRRSFLAMSATMPWAFQAVAAPKIPVGLELYSVRDVLKQDPSGTVRAVAAMGASLAPVRRAAAIDARRLMGENLVSGVVSAREGNDI